MDVQYIHRPDYVSSFSPSIPPLPDTLARPLVSLRAQLRQPGPVKFWIIDDEEPYRGMLEAALNLEAGIHCTGSFPDAESALERCADCSGTCGYPDVILLDVMLPGMLGTAAIRKLKEFDKTMRVVMLSVREDDVLRAILEEADGYLYKPRSTVGVIANAVLEVDHGGCPFDPYLLVGVLRLIRAKYGLVIRDDISKAERRVLELLHEGKEIKSIAEQLNLSMNTVSSHVRSIRRKYDVHSIRELLVKLQRECPF